MADKLAMGKVLALVLKNYNRRAREASDPAPLLRPVGSAEVPEAPWLPSKEAPPTALFLSSRQTPRGEKGCALWRTGVVPDSAPPGALPPSNFPTRALPALPSVCNVATNAAPVSLQLRTARELTTTYIVSLQLRTARSYSYVHTARELTAT